MAPSGIKRLAVAGILLLLLKSSQESKQQQQELENTVQELAGHEEELKSAPYSEGSTTPYNINYVSVTYTLWIGTNVTESYTITVMTEKNSTFYHVMQIAAEQDSRYIFEATEYSFGHYINTIDKYKEDLLQNYYWMLYEVPELPDPSNPPEKKFKTPVGVDGLIVEDGHHYLFWYRFVSPEEMEIPPA